MNTALQSLRYTFRTVVRNPGVSLVVVLTLALGIGLNVAIFSVIYAVLLRPLPYKDSDRLVQIWGQSLSRNIPFHFVQYPDLAEWKKQSTVFDGMSAYTPISMNISNRGEPRRLACLRVNAGFFSIIGVPLLLGRDFLPEEDMPGSGRVVVLNHTLWQEVFASDPQVLGKPITLDGSAYTVVGVLPPGFLLGGNGTELDLFVPLAASPVRVQQPSPAQQASAPQPASPRPQTAAASPTPAAPPAPPVSVGCYARLKPGVTLAAAQSEMNTICSRLDAQFAGGLPRSVRVWGLREFMVRNVRLSLWILMGAVGLVLLIACANVANIMLARAGVRRQEMALRAALGAGRGRIARQVLNESVVLSLSGGVLGVLLAYWGVTVLVKTSSASYPLLKSTTIDLPVIGFTIALSILAGMIFGSIPALAMARQATRFVLQGWLKESSPAASAGRSSSRVRAVLIVTEVALALMLLITASLLMRSFLRLQQVNPGFEARGVLTANITLPAQRYPAGARRVAFYEELLRALRPAPGVESAAIVDILPLSGSNTGTGFFPEGRPVPRPSEVPIVWMRSMSEDYFRTMSIPLLSGRQFTDKDDSNARAVAIVNRTLAQRFWPGEDPIGKNFHLGGPSSSVLAVVGVCGDVRHTNVMQPPEAEVFLCYRQIVPSSVTVLVRTKSNPAQLAPVVRQAVSSVDREMPISRVRTMENALSDSISSQRLTMLLLGIFAAVALMLAAVGVYGVISYAVSQRTQEIGVRRALGAPDSHVLTAVAGRPWLLAIAGEIVGLGATLALRRLIDSQLYGSTSLDPMIFTVVPLLLAAVASVAAYLAARRATQVDPLIALRR